MCICIYIYIHNIYVLNLFLERGPLLRGSLKQNSYTTACCSTCARHPLHPPSTAPPLPNVQFWGRVPGRRPSLLAKSKWTKKTKSLLSLPSCLVRWLLLPPLPLCIPSPERENAISMAAIGTHKTWSAWKARRWHTRGMSSTCPTRTASSG